MSRPPDGTRIRLTIDVDRYPDFIASAGNTGTVIESTDDMLVVKFDQHIEGAEEWDNAVQFVPEDNEWWENPPLETLVSRPHTDERGWVFIPHGDDHRDHEPVCDAGCGIFSDGRRHTPTCPKTVAWTTALANVQAAGD